MSDANPDDAGPPDPRRDLRPLDPAEDGSIIALLAELSRAMADEGTFANDYYTALHGARVNAVPNEPERAAFYAAIIEVLECMFDQDAPQVALMEHANRLMLMLSGQSKVELLSLPQS